MSALDKQEGGSHYKDYPIQPVEFITKNKLGFLEGCVVKRVCRWRAKNGIEDLRKAIHELELLIEMEEAAEKREHMDREAKEKRAVNRGPAADSSIQGYCLPEGAKWPQDVPNGTRILVWRPRENGAPGTWAYGWVEIGFMWDGELVCDPPAG